MTIRLAAIGVALCAGLAFAAGSDPARASEGKQCTVTVDRAYSDGTYQVTRQELANGDCVCYVQTGPSPQADTTEKQIEALRIARKCDNATALAVPEGSAATATKTASGGAGPFKLIAFAAAGAGAIAAAASGGSNGPSSP